MLHPLRLQRIIPKPPLLILLIILKVPLEPLDMGLAFEGQDVCADAVEEEAVVADDDGAAGEVDEGVLQSAEGFDVEVVGGLVEQEDIAAGPQEPGHVDAVALAA